MIVSLGDLPPCRASSSSCSIRSRGSYAILLPPSNAEPACDVDALTVCEADETLGVGVCLLEVALPLRPHASSSSSAADDDAATRRRESPPAEDMVDHDDAGELVVVGRGRGGERGGSSRPTIMSCG